MIRDAARKEPILMLMSCSDTVDHISTLYVDWLDERFSKQYDSVQRESLHKFAVHTSLFSRRNFCMSKIAIISQPDQGVLIDVSGCTTLKEALEHLSSTLQVSDQFWHGMHVSINLGALAVSSDELGKILALAKGVGIRPVGVYSTNDDTRESLRNSNIPLGSGKPMTLPTVAVDPHNITRAEVEDKNVQKSSPFATITMRVVDAMSRRTHKDPTNLDSNQLEDMEAAHLNEKGLQGQSAFPHIKPRRKVSLDGRPIGSDPSEQTATDRSEPVSKEKVEPKQSLEDTVPPSMDAAKEADELVTAIIEGDCSRSPERILDDCIDVEATESVDNEKPSRSEVSAIAKEPTQAHTKTKEECISDAATGSDVKVMTIQVVDSMIEAQPAQKSIAQASTVTDEVVTQVDADAPSKINNPKSVSAAIEEAEDLEFEEEEVEADSIDVETPSRVGPTTLYLRQTLRSGQTVSHKGHLVIIGDINPGAEVMADGDITVWGCLRGVAHAGIGGNTSAEIRALKLQPIQIRIAHAIARAPDRPRVSYAATTGPETARMVDGKIKVVRSRLD